MAAKNNGQIKIDAAMEHEDNGLRQAGRKVFLFYIGVLASAIEEGYGLVSKLVEGRHAAEREGHRLVSEVIQRRKPADEVASGPAKAIGSLPVISTKADIRTLDDQLTWLDQQLDALAKG